MTPKRLNRVLKIVILLVIVAIGVGLYFVNMHLTVIATETAQLRSQAEINQKHIKTYETTQAKVSALGYVSELAKRVLPSTSNQSEIVAELSQFAAQSNLGIAKINFDQTKAAPSPTASKPTLPPGVVVTSVVIEFNKGSKYDDVLKFLRLTENNRRKIQTTAINLGPSAEDRTKLDKVSITLNLYSKDGK